MSNCAFAMCGCVPFLHSCRLFAEVCGFVPCRAVVWLTGSVASLLVVATRLPGGSNGEEEGGGACDILQRVDLRWESGGQHPSATVAGSQ